MAVALTLFETTIRLESSNGAARTVPIGDFYLLPGSTPDRETELQEGELITEISIPKGDWDTSIYLKLRDRESYAFALASVAVAVKLKGNIISDLRVVVGGLAARPWRCLSIENAQRGQILNPRAIESAARLLFADADLDEHRAFKVELGIRVILRALNLAVSQSVKSV